MPELLDKHRERSHWRERLAEFSEWVEKRDHRRFELVMLICLVVGLTVLIASAYAPSLHGFAEGKAAPRSITADETVTVVDMAATEELKDQVAKRVPPVYVTDPNARTEALSILDEFMQTAETLRQQVAAGGDLAAAADSLEAVAPQAEGLSRATVEYLLTCDPDSFELVWSQALAALNRLYSDFAVYEDRMDDAQEDLRATVAGLRGLADAPPALSLAVYEVGTVCLTPSEIIDHAMWDAAIQEQVDQVAPVAMTVEEGQMVVEEGQIVTAQDMLTLQALGFTSTRYGWKVWLGIFFITLLEAVVFSRLLYRFHKGTKEVTNNMLLALVFLLVGGTLIARLLIIPPLSAYLIPVAAMGMVVSVILNARSALLLITLASVNVGLLTDLSMRYTIAAFLVGALSLYLVSKVTKRAALLGTALISMFLAAFTIFALEIFTEASVGDALRSSLWGFGNGFLSGFLTILLLLLFESVLNVTTPLRLLELADPAHPLLKKLLQLAPGTYNHSIMMGTLAEAAAEAINANPNLARVGAYYHDIGKTARPEYFIENQIYVGNPHDHLSPHLSKVAIAAHVRDGERMGRMYGLPKPVVDIIKQHHGTSLMAFFYAKAKQSSKGSVAEESFRYEGERPRSKEAGIIMLADGVEAAVRALERPTRRKIQGVIHEIIKQRVDDGQLDESELTQADMHHISEAFDMSLVGLLGHRIQYPGYAPEPSHTGPEGNRRQKHEGKAGQGSEAGD